jgi:hypothetical protein
VRPCDHDPGERDPAYGYQGRGIGHNAAIAVGWTMALLGLFLVRGMPVKEETEAAEGGALPL